MKSTNTLLHLFGYMFIISISLSIIGCSNHTKSSKSPIQYKAMRTVLYEEIIKEKNGLLYRKGEKEPYTGIVISNYPSGRLRTKGSVRNGKMVEDYNEYFEDGQVKTKGEYRNGLQEGTWITNHNTGAVALKGQFINGLLEGTWYVYDQNGLLAKKIVYQNGILMKTLRYNSYKEKIKTKTKTVKKQEKVGDVHLGTTEIIQ